MAARNDSLVWSCCLELHSEGFMLSFSFGGCIGATRGDALGVCFYLWTMLNGFWEWPRNRLPVGPTYLGSNSERFTAVSMLCLRYDDNFFCGRLGRFQIWFWDMIIMWPHRYSTKWKSQYVRLPMDKAIVIACVFLVKTWISLKNIRRQSIGIRFSESPSTSQHTQQN